MPEFLTCTTCGLPVGDPKCPHPDDLDLGRRDDYPSANEYGWQDEPGDLAYEGSW